MALTAPSDINATALSEMIIIFVFIFVWSSYVLNYPLGSSGVPPVPEDLGFTSCSVHEVTVAVVSRASNAM